VVRRAGIIRLLTAAVVGATTVTGLVTFPAAADSPPPAPLVRAGWTTPIVLGPAPEAPTVVGGTSAPATSGLHASSATSTFVVHYDAGFNANPAAKTAFQAAVDQWSNVISTPVPIHVDASFTALPSGVLGSAGPKSLYANFAGAPQTNTYYPVALANARHGSDLNPALSDIGATFSSTYANFYFGTDGHPPAGKIDFESVVLHELGHGLGFLGSMNVSGGVGSCGCSGKPFVYDRSVTSNGTAITSYADGSATLAGALQGKDLRFTGAAATASNGGVAPRLYAPATWQGGSSYSHLDEATYPAGNANSLMTPAIGPNEVIHSPGPLTLGIFQDSGWTVGGLPSISISSARLNEGNNGSRKLRANVTLSSPVPWPVTARFATSNATAVAGFDYVAGSGTVTIPAGATTATPAFTLVADRLAEPAEKFTVSLSAPSGAVLGTASTSLYILNDDPSSGVNISAGTASIAEGASGDRIVSVTLALSLTKSKAITVDWATGTGTATPGVDYEPAGGTATFAPGAAYARVQVVVHADTDDETNETIRIVLSNSVGAPISKPLGTISITDDD
jgi:hypothetical protein